MKRWILFFLLLALLVATGCRVTMLQAGADSGAVYVDFRLSAEISGS